MSAMLELSMRPEWDEIEQVRARSLDFLKDEGVGEEVVDAVTMVACELAENAVKYGQFADPEDRIGIALALRKDRITVEVKNRVGEEVARNLSRLDEMIQWIRGHQDPFQAYLERLKEVSVQHLEAEESGLGLVRIAYEGQSILDFYVDENNIVSVSAIYEL